ncbi:MAG: hypothetical protein DRJ97_06780 [Thermoprotei archaeon]|nr:MAG: hypothetical protein DRJ97_06780 [Thermoprotei archaeon]
MFTRDKGVSKAAVALAVALIVALAVLAYQSVSIQRRPSVVYPAKLEAAWATPPLIDRDWLIERGLYDRAYSWRGFVKGSVVASHSGDLVAVTTHKGEVYVYSGDGKLLRKLSFELGEVPVAAAFSPDDRYLAVGLSSKKGELRVYDTSTWSLAWSYDASGDLLGESNATEATIVKKPYLGNRVHFVAFDEAGRMYLAASSRIIDPAKQRPIYKKLTIDLMKIYPELKQAYPGLPSYTVSVWASAYASRVVAVDVGSWSIAWRWPKQGVARSFIPMIDVDAEGRYLALCTWGAHDPYEPYEWHGGIVTVLDAKSGEALWRWDVPPRVPVFNRTYIWNGIGITDDGKYVIVEPSDGRVFAIDNLGSCKLKKPVFKWTATIMTPVEADVLLIPKKGGEYSVIKAYIYAGTYFAGIVGGKVAPYASATYSAYWSPRFERKPLNQHPNQTKLFLLDLETGELLFVDRFLGKPMYGKVVPFAVKDGLLIGAIGNDWTSSDASMAGVYVYDVERLERVARFLTVEGGYGVPIDVAAAGDKIYVLTAPIDLATSPKGPANIVGEYRLVALTFKG